MIPYGDIRKTTPVSGTTRQRTVAPASAFADRNQRPFLDFDDKSGPAAQSSGMNGSVLDLYAPSWKADIVQRDERDARIDHLPPAVQKLATDQGVTSIELLEVVAAVHRKSAVMGGQKVQLFASDLGRALGIPSTKAETLLTEAAQKGFIASFPGSYWASRT